MGSSETGTAKSYLGEDEEARYVCGCQCNLVFVLGFWRLRGGFAEYLSK